MTTGTDQQEEAKVHLVTIEVDHHPKEIRAGEWNLLAFKIAVGIPASDVVDEIQDGHFKELTDSQPVNVKAGDKFISHAPSGASS